MKQILILVIILSLGMSWAIEKIDVLDNEPFPLQHWLTAAEAARWDEVTRDFYVTDPPPGEIHNIAEFEQMEGVLVRYPFGIPVSLIAMMSQHTKVVTLVSSTSQQNSVTSQYNSAGANIDNCEFLIAPTDSYWTRDYGPWYVIDGNGEFGITNFRYNRPRPNDNDVPIEVAEYLDINLWGMDVYHTGGNYMTDGLGLSASTDLVYEENSISNTEVDLRMLNYLGIQTYYVLEDPNNTYIDHIDCWGKFLAVDKVLIREVPTTHAQYDEIEATADYFANQTTSWGNNFQVFRVYTPNDQPYTNSLILNDYVYVPITGSQWDDEALASYEYAMPGYNVVGIMSAPPAWESTDALHCRTKGIADREMLYIYHLPVLDEQSPDVDIAIECDLTAYSGEAIIADSVLCFYKTGGGDYETLVMDNIVGDTWQTLIPGQPSGAVVSYYLQAVDAGGNSTTHPLIGGADPHIYYSGGMQEPELDIDPEIIEMVMTADTTTTTTLELTNTGGGVINYTLEFQDTSRDITGSSVVCESEYFSPGETTTFNFTAYNESSDNEWISGVSISFPAGFEVINASDFISPDGAMQYDGITGDGVTITWFGETPNHYGILHGGESATANVEISVSSGFSGDAVLNWTLSGDNYGSAPHIIDGEMNLEIYGGAVSWISADHFGGELWAMETDDIMLTFNSVELETGLYTCNLIINDDNGNENIVPIMLTVNSTVGDNDHLPMVTDSYAYPNPFYQNGSRSSSNFYFTLSEYANDVTIAIYNIRGQKAADLYAGALPSGEHQFSWSGDKAAAGIYFYLLKTGNTQVSEKVILLK